MPKTPNTNRFHTLLKQLLKNKNSIHTLQVEQLNQLKSYIKEKYEKLVLLESGVTSIDPSQNKAKHYEEDPFLVFWYEDLDFDVLDITKLKDLEKWIQDYLGQNTSGKSESIAIACNSIFEDLPVLNVGSLTDDLKKFQSVTEKLDFLKKVKENYYVPFAKELDKLPKKERLEVQKKYHKKIFEFDLVSPLMIPKPIYDQFFKESIYDAEFTYWFLRYNSMIIFQRMLEKRKVEKKLKSPLRDQFIASELQQISYFENRAEGLLLEGKIDVFSDNENAIYLEELEYLRVRADYYRHNAIPMVHSMGLSLLSTYAEFVYFKELLIREQNILVGDPIDAIAFDEVIKEHAGEEEPFLGIEFVEYNTTPVNDSKISFKHESIDDIFNILKDFFSEDDQKQLRVLFETGDVLLHKLIFKSTGNRLADAFKQLIKKDFIIGCDQKGLEQWIASNFQYTYRGQVKDFKLRYLNDIISTNADKCKDPLLDVKKDFKTNQYIVVKA